MAWWEEGAGQAVEASRVVVVVVVVEVAECQSDAGADRISVLRKGREEFITRPALRILAFSRLKLVSRKGNLEVMDSARSWFHKLQPRGDKVKPGPAKKEAGSVKDMQKPPIDEAPSNITKQKVAAAKQYIENHYKAQMKSLQDRKERRWMLERKLADAEVSEEEQNNILKNLEKKETEYMRRQRHKMGVDDFELLTIIGRGAFGEVRLCKEKTTGHVYAMKKLKKSEMLRRGQVEHVKAERNLLAEVDSAYIVKLYFSFQDEEYLYLIMEYLPGGDMMTLLMRKDTLTEDEARFYIAETVLAIESIHKHNYIHRDIKPDNLLLDRNGHMKLSDFGLCKPLDSSSFPNLNEPEQAMGRNIKPTLDDKRFNVAPAPRRTQQEQLQHWQKNRRMLAYSTVGTPDYIAPEVLLKKGYGVECDWLIVNWRNHLKFPEEAKLSSEAKDLISRLLCNVEHRLGTKGAHEIKAHVWFRGIQWERLYQMDAAFKPEVNDELDTQNFEKFEEASAAVETSSKSGPWRKMLPSKDVNFVGYTYKNFEIVNDHEVPGIAELKKKSNKPKRPTIKSLWRYPKAKNHPLTPAALRWINSNLEIDNAKSSASYLGYWSLQRIVTCRSRVAYLMKWCGARVSLVRFSWCAATERSAKRRAMAAARVLGTALIGLSLKHSSASSHSTGSSPLLLRWQWRRLYSSSGSRLSMSLKAGIVGLPNVGKSTLFNAVVENGKAQAANFPFCTIEPNVGIVAVPDPRLDVLGGLSKSQRTVPASIEFVDIAGLVKGASQGEGLGNKFLSHIREVDSILQIEKRLDKLKKGKAKDSQSKMKEEAEKSALEKIQKTLMDGKPARSVSLSDLEKESIRHLCLLTMKPIIYVANVAESDLAEPDNNPHVKEVINLASELQSGIVTVSAQVEAELTELAQEERIEFLKSLGVSESGLGNLIRATYKVLGLRTYFTSGEKETKAWTILAGMTAPQAAGVIHSDFEKGFIRAETVSYDDFVAAGSLAAAREKGLLRSEGKDYIVREGDVMLFRFNV
ncbi:Protein kinase C terminal domain [Musa troglodytarum]|uniref:non-specific serine/threonine protein kinase n=1 Tax=Musa troglodytarum TaxID=320322 RepID=A0A9E7GRY3_9LILI|nr:Protein kinase C terminal domain [Musa troglodytarum]